MLLRNALVKLFERTFPNLRTVVVTVISLLAFITFIRFGPDGGIRSHSSSSSEPWPKADPIAELLANLNARPLHSALLLPEDLLGDTALEGNFEFFEAFDDDDVRYVAVDGSEEIRWDDSPGFGMFALNSKLQTPISVLRHNQERLLEAGDARELRDSTIDLSTARFEDGVPTIRNARVYLSHEANDSTSTRRGRLIVFDACVVEFDDGDGYPIPDTLVFHRCTVKAHLSWMACAATLVFNECPVVIFSASESYLQGDLVFDHNYMTGFVDEGSHFQGLRFVQEQPVLLHCLSSAIGGDFVWKNSPVRPRFDDCIFSGTAEVEFRNDSAPGAFHHCLFNGPISLKALDEHDLFQRVYLNDTAAVRFAPWFHDCLFAQDNSLRSNSTELLLSQIAPKGLDAFTLGELSLIPFRDSVQEVGVDSLRAGSLDQDWARTHRFYDQMALKVSRLEGSESSRKRALSLIQANLEDGRLAMHASRLESGPFKWADLWGCLRGNALRYTVNFGHNGEVNLAWVCILIVLWFTFVYQRWYSAEFVELAFDKAQAGHVLLNTPRFLTCFYVSAWVFLAIKPPAKVFAQTRGLQALLLAEWIIGILMAVMFFIYIAPNYPIFQKLFG